MKLKGTMNCESVAKLEKGVCSCMGRCDGVEPARRNLSPHTTLTALQSSCRRWNRWARHARSVQHSARGACWSLADLPPVHGARHECSELRSRSAHAEFALCTQVLLSPTQVMFVQRSEEGTDGALVKLELPSVRCGSGRHQPCACACACELAYTDTATKT